MNVLTPARCCYPLVCLQTECDDQKLRASGSKYALVLRHDSDGRWKTSSQIWHWSECDCPLHLATISQNSPAMHPATAFQARSAATRHQGRHCECICKYADRTDYFRHKFISNSMITMVPKSDSTGIRENAAKSRHLRILIYTTRRIWSVCTIQSEHDPLECLESKASHDPFPAKAVTLCIS